MRTIEEMPDRRPALVLPALLMLVAAACASGGPDDATGARPGSSTVASPTPHDPSPTGQGGGAGGSDRPVAEVLRFSAPRLGGGTIEGVEFAGNDVAFWFWAPW